MNTFPVKITIKVKSFSKKELKQTINQIQALLFLESKKNAKLKQKFFWYKPLISIDKSDYFINYNWLPRKKEKVGVIKSPFIFKKSGETFVRTTHSAILTVNINTKYNINQPKAFFNFLFLKWKNKVKLNSNTNIIFNINKTVMVE